MVLRHRTSGARAGRSHYPRHERTSTADCNTVRVHRLSVDELAQLERAWDDLARFYPSADPPQSDEEVVAAGLDAWIAGIVLSDTLADHVGCVGVTGVDDA